MAATDHRYPWYVRFLFWIQKQQYGVVLEPTRLWGRRPLVFIAFAFLYGAFNRKRALLDPMLRALVSVRVSQINHCEFCIDINSGLALQRGAGWEKVSSLGDIDYSPHFSDRERMALKYSEAVTKGDKSEIEKLRTVLSGAFDEDEIIELTGFVAFQNMSSKFNAALSVPAQGFCPLPQDSRSGPTAT